MIKTIKMKSVATYSDEGATIDDCTKVNFFYGANGSGKSTISNYLQSPEEPGYSSCNIVWDAGAHTDIIVYNRRFRERNFKENIAGVFTLGEATIEDINALSVLKSEKDDKGKELVKRIESLNNKKTEIEAHKNRFRDTVWEKYLNKMRAILLKFSVALEVTRTNLRMKLLKDIMNVMIPVKREKI